MPKIANKINKHFTQCPNAIIIDGNISDGALRVFLYMCTKPLNWQFNNADIQKKLGIKRAETIAKYWKELMSAGWIIRQSKLNDKGNPTGLFDYVLNFSLAAPNTKNADIPATDNQGDTTMEKADAEDQQIRENRIISNNEFINNNKKNNTNIIYDGNYWLKLADQKNIYFDVNERASIATWANHQLVIRAEAKIPTSYYAVEAIIDKLAKFKSENYDICSWIEDSIPRCRFELYNPNQKHLKKLSSVTNLKENKRPYQFNNTKYIYADGNNEQDYLVKLVDSMYNRGLNPKQENTPLTTEESYLIQQHKKHATNLKMNFAAYIRKFEVITHNSLLDQSTSEIKIESYVPQAIAEILETKKLKMK